MTRSRHPAPAHPQARSAETRAAILAAAERVFAEAGLAGARTDAIAAAAGVNKALLYYYFQSKKSLYEAVVEDHFQAFNRQALEVLAAPGSARAVLLRYVGLHFDFISARHRYAPIYQQLMTTGGKGLAALAPRAPTRCAGCWNAACVPASSAAPTAFTWASRSWR
jgi:AcrR family transcriptional regulator